MTPEVHHQFTEVNGLRYHLAICGQGPLVLFTHGFPESWYSWRKQLPFLANAGFQAVAVDMPGYGQTDKPKAVERYNQIAISDDMAALATALGHNTFVSVGHDWGAPTAWHTALRFPERVRGVVGMSVPYGGRPPQPPTQGFKKLMQDKFFYMLYFQPPGVAEAELEPELASFLRRFWWSTCSESDVDFFKSVPAEGTQLFDVMPDPGHLPSFIEQDEANYYFEQFSRSGLRGPLNYYRNLDRNWELSESYAQARFLKPALFLYGDKDPVPHFGGEMQRMPEYLSDLRQIEVADCGHWIQQEQAEQVNQHLLNFLHQLK